MQCKQEQQLRLQCGAAKANCRSPMPPSSPEPAAERGPWGSSSLVASLPSVAALMRLPGGVPGGLMDKGEIMAPVVLCLKSLNCDTGALSECSMSVCLHPS